MTANAQTSPYELSALSHMYDQLVELSVVVDGRGEALDRPQTVVGVLRRLNCSERTLLGGSDIAGEPGVVIDIDGQRRLYRRNQLTASRGRVRVGLFGS